MVEPRIKVAVIDYGLGNLFSVAHACEHAGMEGVITSNKQEILGADAVILPGVGAFGGAMDALRKLDLVDLVKEIARSDKPLLGVCLGMQLLMTESHEFGTHPGLDIIKGSVVRIEGTACESGGVKVPQVGWNRIFKAGPNSAGGGGIDRASWSGSLFEGLADGEFMYFIHSYYVKPQSPEVVMSTSKYGGIEFCSALRYRNIFATQFHPERSGHQGLQIYRNLAALINRTRKDNHAVRIHP